MNPVKKFESKLLKIDVLTPTVNNFHFSVPADFAFDAGQYVSLQVQIDDKTIRRSYSIASNPDIKNKIELCIKIIDNGAVTPTLFKINVGQVLPMIGPMGHFIIQNKEKDLFFIGTGTGVTPFRSMILQLLQSGFKKKIVLCFGIRYEDEVLFEKEFRDLEKEYPHFTLRLAISRPKNPDYAGDKGHVQVLLKKFLPDDFKGEFYICGLNVMIEQVRKLLIDRGFTKEQIKFERYD